MAGALKIDDGGIPFRKVIREASPCSPGILQAGPSMPRSQPGGSLPSTAMPLAFERREEQEHRSA